MSGAARKRDTEWEVALDPSIGPQLPPKPSDVIAETLRPRLRGAQPAEEFTPTDNTEWEVVAVPMYYETAFGKAQLVDGIYEGEDFSVRAEDMPDAGPVYSQGPKQDLSKVPSLKPSSVDLDADAFTRFNVNRQSAGEVNSLGRIAAERLVARPLTEAAYGQGAGEAAAQASNERLRAQELEYQNLRPWWQADDPIKAAKELLLATGGTIAGSLQDPTALIGGVGKNVIETFGRNAAAAGVLDVPTQLSNIDQGIQAEYDPSAETFNQLTGEFDVNGPTIKTREYDPAQTGMAALVGGALPVGLEAALNPQARQEIVSLMQAALDGIRSRKAAERGMPKVDGPPTPEELAEVMKDPNVVAVMEAQGQTSSPDVAAAHEARVEARRQAEAARPAPESVDQVAPSAIFDEMRRQRAEDEAVSAGDIAAAFAPRRAPTATPEAIAVDSRGVARKAGQVNERVVPQEDPGLERAAERQGTKLLPAPGKAVTEPMTDAEVRLAQIFAAKRDTPATEPSAKLVGGEERAPRTLDQQAEQRQSAEAFTLAERQRSRLKEAEAPADIRDTQAAGLPKGTEPKDVLLDEGNPVKVLDTIEGKDSKGRKVQLAKVRRYDPRTDEFAGDSIEYFVPAASLKKGKYTPEPRRAQDFEVRTNKPTPSPEKPRTADAGIKREPNQTFRETVPDPNQQFPAAGEGRSPLPPQPEPTQPRYSTAEELLKDYRARERAARAEEAAREERAGKRYKKEKSSNTPKGQGEDKRWHVDEDGYVISDKGGPIVFADQKQAAQWIINKGQKLSPDQNFEIANHPAGKGFTAREHSRTPHPEEPKKKGMGDNERGAAGERSEESFKREAGDAGPQRAIGGPKSEVTPDATVKAEAAPDTQAPKAKAEGAQVGDGGSVGKAGDKQVAASAQKVKDIQAKYDEIRSGMDKEIRAAESEMTLARGARDTAFEENEALGSGASFGKNRKEKAAYISDANARYDAAKRRFDDILSARNKSYADERKELDDFAQSTLDDRDGRATPERAAELRLEDRDDLTPQEFAQAIRQVFGEERTEKVLAKLGNKDTDEALQYAIDAYKIATGKELKTRRTSIADIKARFRKWLDEGAPAPARDYAAERETRRASDREKYGYSEQEADAAFEVTTSLRMAKTEKQFAKIMDRIGDFDDGVLRAIGKLVDADVPRGMSKADAVQKIREAVNFQNIKEKGPSMFFSGPSDPRLIRRIGELLFGGSKEWKAHAVENAKIFSTAAGPKEGLKRLWRGSTSMARAVFYSADGRVRNAGKQLGSKTMEEVADMFHAPAGGKKAVGQTYEEAVQEKLTSAMNELSDVLESFLTEPEMLDQLRRMVQSGGGDPKSALGKAAADLRRMLKDELKYLKDAGVELGEVKTGYFPREFDDMAVMRNPVGATKAFEKEYRMLGADAETAKAQAEALVDSILLGDAGAGVFRGGDAGGRPAFTAGRVFGKSADARLAEFYIQDPARVLGQYFHRSARRAEAARRFGDKWEKWTKLEHQIREEVGAKDAGHAIDDVRALAMASTGMRTYKINPRIINASAWIRAWTGLALLEKVTISSLQELVMPGVRSGRMLDQFKGLASAASEAAQMIAGDKSRRMEFAEDLGIIYSNLGQNIQVARFFGDDPGSVFLQKAQRNFFRNVGLEQVTNITRAIAASTGQTFVRRMAKSIDKEWGKMHLRELGIPNDKQAAFAKWLDQFDGLPDGADLQPKSGKLDENARMYRTAMLRFVNQTVQNPTAATKPSWASHPLGAIAFQLNAFNFAFTKNVLWRGGRRLKEAVTNADLDGIERAKLAVGTVAPLLMLAAFGVGISVKRDELFKRKRVETAADDEESFIDGVTQGEVVQGVRHLSRIGAFGGADPWVNFFTQAKYDKDPVSALTGPAVGAGANLLAIVPQLLVNNSEETNTTERKAAKLAYDFAIEPATNLMLNTIMPPNLMSAMATQAAGQGELREAFVTALAGEDEREE